MSGASSPIRRAVPRVPRPASTRARLRPTTSFEQLCVRAYSTTSAAASLPESIDGPRAEFLRQLDGAQYPLALRGRKPLQRRRLDVDRRPFDAELRGEPRGAAHDVLAAGAGTDAAQQRVLGLPDALDRLVGAVGLDVVLHAIGRAAQRELAQRHQVALAEEVLGGALDLLGQVDLAGREPREQIVGGDVDQHDFVGLVEEGIGHRLPDA